ncbi:MAG TPA: hypothetical protein VN107_01470 [Microbacterium sp.]|nr:hypothetical protein [Microbacterium sp.]
MLIRSIGAAAVAALALGLAGCSGSLFLSQADARREAVEQTVRHYVAAMNEVDYAQPATHEPVYAWLTDEEKERIRSYFDSVGLQSAYGMLEDPDTDETVVRILPTQDAGADRTDGTVRVVLCYLSTVGSVSPNGDTPMLAPPDGRIRSRLITLVPDPRTSTGVAIDALVTRNPSLECDR